MKKQTDNVITVKDNPNMEPVKPVPNENLQAYAFKRQLLDIINSSELSIIRKAEIISYISLELGIKADEQSQRELEEYQQLFSAYELRLKEYENKNNDNKKTSV